MAVTNKKSAVNIDNYNQLHNNNPILPELLEQIQSKFDFPIPSVLEIGTGTGTFLTKYLILKERSKDIDKFYGMEPLGEFFEESKKHVVRLSRTDATSHEYFGGNPFNVITFAFVISHIFPDKKKTFLQNISNNLDDFDGGKLIVMEAFLPDYESEEEKKESQSKFFKANEDHFASVDNKLLAEYFRSVSKQVHEDYFIGDYKISVEKFVDILKHVGFTSIETELYIGKGESDWKKTWGTISSPLLNRLDTLLISCRI
jgi:SAM-dependent methyltransferase